MGKHKKNKAAATRNKDKNKKKPAQKANTINFCGIVTSMTIVRPSSMDKKEYQRFIHKKVEPLFNAIHQDHHEAVVSVFRETSQHQRSLLANALIHRGKEGHTDHSKVSLLFETLIPTLKDRNNPGKRPSSAIVKTLLENGASTVDDDVFCIGQSMAERGLEDRPSLIGYCAHDIRCHSIASLLLRHKVNPHVLCPGGASPLFYAIHFNSLQLVRDLVEEGTDTLNVILENNLCPAILLALAAEAQQKDFSTIPIFRLLKEMNATHLHQMTIENSYRTIHMAMNLGHLEIVQYALAQQGPNRKSINSHYDGRFFDLPMIYMACCYGHPEIVRELIRAGFPTRGLCGIVKGEQGLTILQSIFFIQDKQFPQGAKNRMELVKVFAEENCLHIEDTTIDQCNEGALLHAVKSGNVEIVSYLIRAAKGNELFLTQENELGQNAAFLAVVMSPDKQMVSAIMECDCALEMFDIETDSGITPLMLACFDRRWLEIVEQLLEFGIAVDRPNSKNEVALHWATELRNLDAVKLLLRWGSKKAAASMKLALTEGGDLDIIYELFKSWSTQSSQKAGLGLAPDQGKLDNLYELFKTDVVH